MVCAIFADETSRAVALTGWTHQPSSDNHGGKYDVEELFNFKKKSMEKNSLPDFAERFASASTDSLIDIFNAQVSCKGWNSARAAHDTALIDELSRRDIDVSAVADGSHISFAHKVILIQGKLTVVAD